MQTPAPECVRCRNRMVSGYLLEAGDHNSRSVTQWVEGAPEKNFWVGLKLKDREVMPVITFRCPHCGYLESYAQAQSPSN